MPFKSEAQRRFAFTKKGMKAFGGRAVVEEFQRATGKRKLPKRARRRK